MSDEVFIVSAYTPDTEREDLLRNLVNQLHAANKDILLVSHSVTPTDIIKKCRYHVYDSENKILFDDKYKFLAWNTAMPKVTIHSKDVGRTYTTLIPVYKLVLYGFGFAKMVGYKYAHYIEYDSRVDNFNFFENNKNILKDHGCLAYVNIHEHPIGFYFAFNLDYYSFDDLKFEEKKFLDKFTEFYPRLYLVEELTRHFFMDNKNPYFKDESVVRSEGLTGALYCSRNSKTSTMSWVVPIVEHNHLYIFISEYDKKQLRVEYVINNTYRSLVAQINEYHYIPICKWNEAKFLKIFINGTPHLEYNLEDESVRQRLIENNFIERHV